MWVITGLCRILLYLLSRTELCILWRLKWILDLTPLVSFMPLSLLGCYFFQHRQVIIKVSLHPMLLFPHFTCDRDMIILSTPYDLSWSLKPYCNLSIQWIHWSGFYICQYLWTIFVTCCHRYTNMLFGNSRSRRRLHLKIAFLSNH